MTAEERLQELQNFESQLVMQLHETQYMIKGYQNALENDNETKTDEESADKAE
jgi:hypothetical protein|tara:strand:+ start:727 stop:885 length:159 start_codon:yes stop_codon:yes gene_type:complete